jgi:hypothetical protein
MNLGRLTEAELERQIADGSLKARLKAEVAAEGKPWNEAEWEVATQLFGYACPRKKARRTCSRQPACC